MFLNQMPIYKLNWDSLGLKLDIFTIAIQVCSLSPSPRFRTIAHEIKVWICVFLSSFFTENEQGPSNAKCYKQNKFHLEIGNCSNYFW